MWQVEVRPAHGTYASRLFMPVGPKANYLQTRRTRGTLHLSSHMMLIRAEVQYRTDSPSSYMRFPNPDTSYGHNWVTPALFARLSFRASGPGREGAGRTTYPFRASGPGIGGRQSRLVTQISSFQLLIFPGLNTCIDILAIFRSLFLILSLHTCRPAVMSVTIARKNAALNQLANHQGHPLM